jgi:hypothetical protein
LGVETKNILVLGCPRSATTYMAELLQALGLDVRHEEMGADGTSSWPMAAWSAQPIWGPSRRSFQFRYILHVVRHPVPTLASLSRLQPDSWDYLHEYVLMHRSASLLEQAAQAYIGWNKLIRAQAPDLIVRAEEADQTLAPWLAAKGLIPALDQPPQLPPKNVNSRFHEPLFWQDVRARLPPALFLELYETAKRYAYG